MKKIIASILACFMLCTSNALALNEVPWLTNMNPPSSWLNQYERDVRIGFGQMLFDAFGSTNCAYSNITISPIAGLSVAANPSSANSVGSLYQYLPESPLPIGGYPEGIGSTALPIDNTQVFLQGLLLSTSYTLGPLNPPGSAGLTIDYLIEGQVAPNTTATSQTIQIIQPTTGITTNPQAYRDLNDAINFQVKAGSPGSNGFQSAPTVDAGWVGIAIVAVPNGTTMITSTMITPLAPFYGFTPSGPGGITPIANGGTGCSTKCFVDVTNTQTVGGAKTYSQPAVFNNTATFNAGAGAGLNSATFGANIQVGGTVFGNQVYSSAAYGDYPFSLSSGDLSAGRSASSGLLSLGGSSANGTLDYGATVGGQFSFKNTNGTYGTVNTGGILTPSITSGSSITLATAAGSGVVIDSDNGLTVENSAGSAFSRIQSGDLLTVSGDYYFGNSSNYISNASGAGFQFSGPILTPGNISSSSVINGLKLQSSNGAYSAPAPAVLNGDIVAQRGNTSGSLWLGGSVTDGTLDWNVNTSGEFTLEHSASGTTTYAALTALEFYPTSDRRLKKHIHPIQDGLADVERLKPVAFNWRNDNRADIGFIAQDVKSVLPQLVQQGKHGIYSLNYSGIIPVLTKAMQQQQSQIEVQQAEIKSLESQVRHLTQKIH